MSLAVLVRRVAAIALALVVPFTAPAEETLADLDARYERLVRAEADLLADRETSARRVTDRDLILIGGADGPVTEMTGAEAAAWLDGLMARVEVLGLDQVYLGALSPWEQMIVAGLHATGLDREMMLDRLRRDSAPLRAREATNAATLEAMLDDVRAEAEALQSRRVALRAGIARGDASDLSGAGTNPVCLDDAVPVDHRAVYWSFYGSDGVKNAVKGPYICRGFDWFDVLTDDELQRWVCAEGNPHDCRMNPERTYRIKSRTIDDLGRTIVLLDTNHRDGITIFASD